MNRFNNFVKHVRENHCAPDQKVIPGKGYANQRGESYVCVNKRLNNSVAFSDKRIVLREYPNYDCSECGKGIEPDQRKG